MFGLVAARGVAREIVLIARQIQGPRRHPSHAGLVRIEPGQQRRAGGAAPRAVIELRHPHAFGGDSIDVGRRDLAAEAADVAVAHVVGEDQDDVRPGTRRLRLSAPRGIRKN